MPVLAAGSKLRRRAGAGMIGSACSLVWEAPTANIKGAEIDGNLSLVTRFCSLSLSSDAKTLAVLFKRTTLLSAYMLRRASLEDIEPARNSSSWPKDGCSLVRDCRRCIWLAQMLSNSRLIISALGNARKLLAEAFSVAGALKDGELIGQYLDELHV